MKYLIFASNKKINFIAKEKQNLNTHLYDIEETWSLFCDLAAKKVHRYLYLIADFETYNSKYFEAVKENVTDEYYRFLTIAFCDTNLRYNMDNMILRDFLTLQLKGFKHTFRDNLAAIEKFQYYVENKLKCDMYINTEDDDISFNSKLIIYTEGVINHGDKYIRLYHLQDPTKRLNTR